MKHPPGITPKTGGIYPENRIEEFKITHTHTVSAEGNCIQSLPGQGLYNNETKIYNLTDLYARIPGRKNGFKLRPGIHQLQAQQHSLSHP